MLRRSFIDFNFVPVDIQPISPFIASKVASRMRALSRYNVIPSTRKMSGDVFESYCHIILNFSTGIKFDFVPMVRIGGHPTVGEKRGWLSGLPVIPSLVDRCSLRRWKSCVPVVWLAELLPACILLVFSTWTRM